VLANVIDNSVEECSALIFNQAPLDSQAKSEWFLDGIAFPEDYRD